MIEPRPLLLLLVALESVAIPVSATQRGELIERTLAIVGGQVITLSDVQVATALGLVDTDAPSDLGRATEALIDRALMLREVQRYTPPEPPEDAVSSKLADIKRRFSGDDELNRVLLAGGFSEQWLQSWIRDDLRIASYLNQRFADDRKAALIADWIADLRRRTAVIQLWKQ